MDLIFKEDYLNLYLDTAIERHRIYIKKKCNEPKPWTNNPIFRDYFFCNLFRQYDKCSEWIIKNIVPLNRWDLIIIYRYLSTYEIYMAIEKEKISVEDLEHVYRLMSRWYESGEKMLNGCFIRNTNIGGGKWARAFEVPFHIVKYIRDNNLNPQEKGFTTIEDMVSWLSTIPATKGFMAYEYTCDFEYSNWFNPIDKYIWTNKGPGAQRGLSLLMYGQPNMKFTQEQFLKGTRKLFPLLKAAVESHFALEDVTMREVEHWLCEFQKYVKYLRNFSSGVKCKHRKYKGAV